MNRPHSPARSFVESAPRRFQPAAARRLEVLAGAFGVPVADLDSPRSPLVDADRRVARDRVWLALAVLGGQLVDRRTTQAVARAGARRGPGAVLEAAAEGARWDDADVRVVRASDATVVNLGDLDATSEAADDVRRTLRRVVLRWTETRPVRLVRWGTGADEDRLIACDVDGATPDGRTVVVVPWHGTYLVPRLARDVRRARLSQALAAHSASWTAAVVEDSAPLTSPEDVPYGRPSEYANALGALRHFRRVVAPSRAAADVVAGWRTMLAAIDEPGPDVRVAPLASELPVPGPEAVAEARERFSLGDFPLVLSVAAQAPRSHRRSVLHAAELLWREGLQFTLTLVGPDGDDADVRRTIARLQREGRSVEVPGPLGEEALAALYHIARFAVLPAVDDGAAVPVIDALASGTPVVTARFGAAAELAAPGGGLLVDPRDHHALTSAVRTLLTRPDVHDTLRRTLDEAPARDRLEATEGLWSALTEDRPAADGARSA
ncbi:glycosyltransferase [Cellulomonas sp. Y8]|uniref:glycosyltransferase n=1 Tax=Cellulomonas sp. Y8 TaxID=2591145 RepID=UPI003D710372